MTDGDYEPDATNGDAVFLQQQLTLSQSRLAVTTWMEAVTRGRVMGAVGDPTSAEAMVDIPIRQVRFMPASRPDYIVAVIDFEPSPIDGLFSFMCFNTTDAWKVRAGDGVQIQQELRVIG